MKRKDVLRLSDAVNDIIDILNEFKKNLSELVEKLEEVDSEILNLYPIEENDDYEDEIEEED
jgi:hypothetical protein